MPLTNTEIVKRIKNARMERGMTQKDIAAKLKRTGAAISDLERGKVQVSAIDLYTLAKLLNKPIEYFYGDDLGGVDIQEIVSALRMTEPEERYAMVSTLRNLIRIKQIYDQLQVTTDKEAGLKLAVEYLGLMSLFQKQLEAMAEDSQDGQQQLAELLQSVSTVAPLENAKKRRGQDTKKR